MCGIFGAVGAGSEHIDVESALDRIAHRGPDGRGVWRAPGIVLGHRRLAVIDLSEAGAQPMVHSESGCVLTFNGEIYNHHALRRELESLGFTFRSRTDSEVILVGYLAWGEDVVERLEGMFAFAVWDPRERRLVLARDRCGEKPLFYSHAGGVFRFASEIKALVASGVEASMEVAALPMLLTFGYVPEAMTMYAGVSRLEPGHAMVLEGSGTTRMRRYWRPPFASDVDRRPRGELRRELRTRVERAVESRLESDVPLGAFLSGGIDSTIIVALMARKLGQKVRTFSIGFRGDPRFDETHYARLVADTYATDHVEFQLEPASFDLMERLVDIHDGPFGDSSAIPTSVVSMLARQRVTVALSGDGGDELFCGYSRFLAAEAAEYIPEGARRALSTLVSRGPRAAGDRTPLGRSLRFLSAVGQPLPSRLLRWSSIFTLELEEAFRPEVRSLISHSAPREWTERILRDTAGASPLSRILDHNFQSYLPYDLLVKSDRCSMTHSLEVRSPFLDTDLIAFAATLPDDTRRRGLRTKVLLREAFADLLPPAIMKRGKMGFGMPLGTWFRGELREYLRDMLAPGARMYAWLDQAYVQRHLDEHFSGSSDHGHRLWLLLTLEVWLRSLRPRVPS